MAEAAGHLEDLLIDVPPQDRDLPDFRSRWLWEFDAFVVALLVMNHTREAAEQRLEELVTAWLGEDPESSPVFCLMMIHPWQ